MARIKTAMGTISPAIAEYEDAVKDAEDAQDDLSEAVERTADLKTEVDGLTSAYGDLKSAVDLILGVEEDLDDQTRSITRAQLTLNDAEKESKAILDGVLEGSKEAVEAEVDRADARERHAKILADEESTTAEIAKANYDLADAEKTYEGVMHGVAADSKEAVKATLDLEDARDSLEDKTAKLIDTIEDAGTTDKQITRILEDNNIKLSQSLKARLATAKSDLKKSTDNTIANLGIEKKAHESAYEGILTEVNGILREKTTAYERAGILREKTTAYERALSAEHTLSEDYKTKQAKVDELKANIAIAEWDRVVEAIKANPAEAEIHIKKYMEEHDIAIPEPATTTTPAGWETGSPYWESGLEGVDYNPPANVEGPRHRQWVIDVASKEKALTNAGRYLNVAIGKSDTANIGIYTDSVARLKKELDDLNANKPAFTAHEGGIIPATGIYRIEMEKGEKIIPLSKQETEKVYKLDINVKQTIINNAFSDVERIGYITAEAMARRIHNIVGPR
jgi:chromosome segregation ATPase